MITNQQGQEMTCPISSNMTKYTNTSKISRLPPYVNIHFLRFFWKKTEKIKAKILKKITFPLVLDLISLCDEELVKQLTFIRSNIESESVAGAAKALRQEWTGEGSCQVTGFYDLIAVLTHAGRSADAGHYIAWVKEDKLDKIWWKMDDEVVTQVKEDDILRLEGGGDWHMAYICIYRARLVPKLSL